MYYSAKTCLNWSDKDFWESSPRFLFKQFDLYIKHNKPNKANTKNKSVKRETTEVKKYKILDSVG